MVQNNNFGFEIVDGLRLRFLVDQYHALTEVVSLKLLLLDLSLDSKADSLTSVGLLDIHTFMMDALYLYWVEQPLFVRS